MRDEKCGGAARPQNLMENFRVALERCDLSDIGFMRDNFTWRKHSRVLDNYICERLDRATANTTWCEMFPDFVVLNGDPHHSDHRVITPRGGNILEWVCDLIDPATGSWDERLIRDTFWAEDARYILQIPLREGVQDFIAWQFDSKGRHSVKSAYKLHVQLLTQQRNGGQGQSINTAGNLDSTADDSWKRLWKLPCPKNIQMFAWRLKHESLAFRTNVERRDIQIDDKKCPFCGRADEDGAHLFIKCKSVKVVWRELTLEKERMELEDISSVHAMLDYLWGLDLTKRLHILTFWWLWWSNRNKLREGEMPKTPTEIASTARCNVLEYLQIYIPQPKKIAEERWRPPGQEQRKQQGSTMEDDDASWMGQGGELDADLGGLGIADPFPASGARFGGGNAGAQAELSGVAAPVGQERES
ncbi:Threonine dehydratase [Hordeum vulgare]|nr:Threonine dehydratase [Hordeum vulgare]